MSTKTSFKRIALVAVSALGFGVMTAIAPASAAVTSIAAGTPSPARPGVVSTVTITPTLSAAATFTAAAKVTSAPTGSALLTASTGNLDFSTAVGGAGTVNTDVPAAGGTSSVIVAASTTARAFTLSFTPDVAGTYSILVSTNASGTSYAAGDPSVVVTITTVGAPTSLTAASIAGAVTTGGQYGQLFSLTMKDASGNPTVLGLNEAILVSDNSADTTLTLGGTSVGTTALAALGSGSANVNGTYIIRAAAASATVPAAAGSAVLTFTGSGLLPATLTVNTTVTLTAATAAASGTTITAGCATAANCTDTNGDAWTTGILYTTGAQSVKFSALNTGSTTAAVVHSFEVRNGSGLLYNTSGTIAAATTAATTLSTTAPAVASADLFNVTVKIITNLTTFAGVSAELDYKAPVAKSVTAFPSVTVLSATGGTTNWVVEVDDQYGVGMPFQAVTVTSSGRNTIAQRSLGVTNADGLLSYAHTDAGTTGSSDTLVFGGAGTSVTRTVTYGAVTVSTITVSGGSKAETVAGSTITDISAADNGPDSNGKTVTAVVKDASGNLLAGVPVTFTVDRGAVRKTATTDYAVVYTNSAGSASTEVIGWLAGKQTVTATAGGVSGTDYFTWGQTTPAEARVLSGKTSGNILSYTVVDRFGNPVKDAVISLSRTGSGLFGNGASTQTITTDSSGTADASFNGSGTVVAELATTTQGYAAAGKIGTTALTAAVAGTTSGIGDTLAPAGVGKVSLVVAEGSDAASQAANAAADAAAEAIDAANAATDAANLAAEAADAATVAAEEARDAADAATAAVEELATQVATLMAALKAQITTLANTVAKIAKKVKA